MTAKELAIKLDGRNIHEGFADVTAEAQASGLVIVHGESDDLILFDGTICDEADCFEGGIIRFDQRGIDKTGEGRLNVIKAIWDNGTDAQGRPAFWTYDTDIPCEHFVLMMKDEVLCVGLVFSINDLVPIKNK